MTEIQRADPRSRRNVMIIIVLGVLIGGVLIVSFERYRPEFVEWLTATPSKIQTRLGIVLAVMAVLGGAPLILLAGYLWSLGSRVERAQQVPLPGSSVVRDTQVLRGQTARRRGRVLKMLAVALAVSALGLLIALWKLWSVLPAQD